ncbi:MAG: hypothetical protein ACOX8S_05975 [Christensenellales bacterium]|jgi:hypothetical protein
MTDIQRLLLENKKKYPLMEITDAVKLIYQSEFGGGHMIPDERAVFVRLQEEWHSLKGLDLKGRRLFEDIGGGIARLDIALAPEHLLPLISKLFALSANAVKGSKASFDEKLGKLQRLCEGERPLFPQEELAAYLTEYDKMGYPPVSHSEVYRRAYSPAYRIVLSKYVHAWPLLCSIAERLKEKGSAVLAIDGRCGGGKTTLAELIRTVFAEEGTAAIAMDDFFLPLEKRTKERFEEPGGNVDYERFADEVLPGLKSPQGFSYRVFDCSLMRLEGERSIPPIDEAPLRIVEGSYSMRPELRGSYDIKVFVDIDEEEQSRRILKRNGPELHKIFVDRWIPLENFYFEALDIQESCDFAIKFEL